MGSGSGVVEGVVLCIGVVEGVGLMTLQVSSSSPESRNAMLPSAQELRARVVRSVTSRVWRFMAHLHARVVVTQKTVGIWDAV